MKDILQNRTTKVSMSYNLSFGFFHSKNRLSALSFLVFIGIMSIFCGCGHQSQLNESKNGLHLYLPIEPFSLDPRVGGQMTCQIILRELFEGLTRYGKNGPELALAESVSISEDKIQYTFHLRPSLWSNGEKVTSSDFEYAWKTAISSSLPTKFSYAFFIIKNAQKAFKGECSVNEVGIVCPDDSTLQVTLEHPAPYFLQWTANPVYSPVCRAVIEQNSKWAGTAWPQYVCNGPYILKDHSLNSHIVLEKNKDYWNSGEVKNEWIDFAIIEDDITAYNMFRAGNLDWYGAPCCRTMLPETIVQLTEEKRLNCIPTRGTLEIECCVAKPHLASHKIRKAIAEAIDRKELVHHLCFDTDIPAVSIVHKDLSLMAMPAFEDGNGCSARKHFEEGMLELGLTRETYPELTLFTDTLTVPISEVIAQQLRKALNISVAVRVYEPKTLYQRLEENEHDLALQGWVSWLEDPIYTLDAYKYRNNLMTYTCWQSDRYIELLEASDATPDAQERLRLLSEAEALIMEELPVIPILCRVDKFARSPAIVGDCYSYKDVPELKTLEKRICSQCQ
jgi:oligopeptide transport system substrate-binding protein